MTVQEKINIWLNDSKLALIQSYDSKNLRASGNWPNELEGKSEIGLTNYKVQMLGSAYTGVLENGRKPNANQSNIKAWVGWAGSTFLKDWVQRKGINASPYAVAYKIARKGITVPNQFNPGGLVSDVFKIERINKLISDIGFVILTDLRSDVIKQFK